MKGSTWRRIAMAAWRRPNDPTAHGMMDVEMTRALAFLEEQRARTTTKLTVTHLVARAVAHALARHPEANVQVRWGRPSMRRTIDVFLQVAFDEGRELSGALIREADRKSLTEVANELASQADAIRSLQAGHLKSTLRLARWTPRFLLRVLLSAADRMSSDFGIHLPTLGLPRDPFGSAMVTSVGMLGIDVGFAPLFPLARCPIVVCVGRVSERPWVVKGGIEARPVMTLSAAFDHRLIDGYQAGRLAQAAREYLENPAAFETVGS